VLRRSARTVFLARVRFAITWPRQLISSRHVRTSSDGTCTKKGLAWLRQLTLPTVSQQLRRDLLLEGIDTLIRQVRRIEQHLNHQASGRIH